MLENKKALTVLVAIALIVSMGIISATATENGTETTEEKTPCPFAGMGPGMGMHKGMMGLDKEAIEARMEESLTEIREKLGLPEDATEEEVFEAMKENTEALREERLNTIREKLGLPEEATEEEVEAALTEWREENMDLIMGLGGPGPGRHGEPEFGPHGMRGFR